MTGMGITSGLGAGATLAGDLISSFGLKKRRNSYPEYAKLNLSEEQGAAIRQNIAQTPKLKNWAADINAFNQGQIEKMLRDAIPMYDQIRDQTSSVISSELKGELPQDVQDQIQRSAAAKALGGGYAGTGMNRNLVARDLGLTSLDLTQKGLNSAQSWINTMAKINQPGLFDFSSMFVTPAQQATFDAEQHAMQYQSQLGKWGLPNSLEYWGSKLQQRGGQVSGGMFGGNNGFGGWGGGMGGGGAEGGAGMNFGGEFDVAGAGMNFAGG